MLDKLESWTQEKNFPYGDLDFWNFVPKSIGSSVSENFANFYPGLVLHVLHWSHPGLVLHVLCQSLRPQKPYPLANDLHPLQCRRRKALVVVGEVRGTTLQS